MALSLDINLIDTEAQKSFSFLEFKKKFTRTTIIIVSSFAVVSLVCGIIFLYFKKTFDNNQKKISSLEETIISLSKTESYVVTISDRAKLITTLMGQRKSYADVFSIFSLSDVPGFRFQDFEFSPGETLKANGICDDNQSMMNLNQRLEEIILQHKFSKVSYFQVTRVNDGKYKFNLEFKR